MSAQQPISVGSEWCFDLIEHYDREIGRVAAGYGLDTYPVQLEIISAEQMMDAYSASSSWTSRRVIAAAAWASPTRSSSTPIPASPT
jgi:hypothetical protein